MSGFKNTISLFVVLSFPVSVRVFSQPESYRDSLNVYNLPKVNMKPRLHYSVGSSFLIVPHVGTMTGFTVSPVLSVPLSPKWSVDGGIIAGRFYPVLKNVSPGEPVNNSFSELSVFGSASYHVNQQLTLYGTGFRQLTNFSPVSLIPKSSYVIGSSYNFGNFSIGLSIRMSQWGVVSSPYQLNNRQGFYSPYNQINGIVPGFGQ